MAGILRCSEIVFGTAGVDGLPGLFQWSRTVPLFHLPDGIRIEGGIFHARFPEARLDLHLPGAGGLPFVDSPADRRLGHPREPRNLAHGQALPIEPAGIQLLRLRIEQLETGSRVTVRDALHDRFGLIVPEAPSLSHWIADPDTFANPSRA